MLDDAPSETTSLGDAYLRLARAERALHEFGAPSNVLELSEAGTRRLHALRDEERDARRALDAVERRIANTRLEFHE